jgi:hypothetical protein
MAHRRAPAMPPFEPEAFWQENCWTGAAGRVGGELSDRPLCPRTLRGHPGAQHALQRQCQSPMLEHFGTLARGSPKSDAAS